MPGQFIPGADSHSRAYGAYGAVGIGVGSTTLGFGWSTGYIYFTLAQARRVGLRRPAAALGQRQGHRPRAAAAVGREAVAGHVGGARRRRPAAADRLSQHDREHDGGGRGAERHLRARRRSPTRGTGRRASPTLPYPPIAPGADARYEIDETLDLIGRAADDRQAVQSRQRVSGRGGRARADHVRQGDDRLVHQRQLRRPAAGGAGDARGARRAACEKVEREFAIFPGSGGVGRQIERPDPRLGGESIAEVFRSAGGEIRQSWCGPCFGQGPDALTAGPARDHVVQPQLAEPHGPRRRRLPRQPRRRRRVGAARLHGAAERARPRLGSRNFTASRRFRFMELLNRRALDTRLNAWSVDGLADRPADTGSPSSTLTFLEIVLGVDNIIFISILSGKLPPEQQPKARRIGLLGGDGDAHRCCCSRSPGSSG